MDRPDDHPYFAEPREVKAMNVIVVKWCAGLGTEADPYRMISDFYSHGGELLARHDSLRPIVNRFAP